MVIPVVQVLYSLEIGGAEKLAITIGAHLDRKRFRPAICALDRDGVLSEELVRYGIPYHVLWRKGIEAGVLARLYRCFRQERARVVHTHQFPQLLFSCLPARAYGARIVHTEHEFYTYRDSARARRLFKPLLRFCSALTVVGPEIARYYIEELGVPPQRIQVIANAVDTAQFKLPGREARSRLGLAAEDLVFGIVGRLEREKDHRTLLYAFRRLADQRLATRLLIVGEGSLRRELEDCARTLGLERSVIFLGARSDIPDVLAALDVFVLSSVHEGVPLSVVEAMGAGKPVIATDVGGLRLLVKPSINGLLVPPSDPVAFEAAMRELAANPELRQSMGARSRQIACESFSVSTMIDRYQEIYESALGVRNVRH
jgi:glycosyltransferase involved in cell wall biosynthesis